MINGVHGLSRSQNGARLVSVVIADDHVFIRDLMARTLVRQRRRRYSVVATVGTAEGAITECARLSPKLLILDICLPDKRGTEILPDLKQNAPTTRVLLCTAFTFAGSMNELARSGAHGFVEKTNTWNEFLVAVERVSRGERYFQFGEGLTAETSDRPSLTPREIEIVQLIARGLTSKEIAAKLHISRATVDTHRTNVMAKFRVRNIAELVSKAFHTGLVGRRLNSITRASDG